MYHKNKILNIFIFLLITQVLTGQKRRQTFDSKNEYIKFVEKKFDIKPDELFYVSTEVIDSTYKNGWEKMSLLLYITGDSIASMEDVEEIMGTRCAPERVINQMTRKDILSASVPTIGFKKSVIKNLITGETLNHEPGEKLTVFNFTYRFGRWGMDYIKRRSQILNELGYKPIIILMDGSDISDLIDVDKTPLNIK